MLFRSYLFEVSEEFATAVDYLAINHPRFGQELVGTHWPFRIDVKNFMALRQQPIRDNHAMTTEVDALGAHVRGTRLVRDPQEFGDCLVEFWRKRVIGVISKVGVAECGVRRIFPR